MIDTAVTWLETDKDFAAESPSGLTLGRQVNAGSSRYPAVWSSLVGDFERERSFCECLSKIEGYRDLPDDWDTYGGKAASPKPLAYARDLVSRLQRLQWDTTISPPYVCPISTGVYLEWQIGDSRLWFEIDEESVLFSLEREQLTLEDGVDPKFDVERGVDLVRRFHRRDDGGSIAATSD